MTADSAQITRAHDDLSFHRDEAYKITRQASAGGHARHAADRTAVQIPPLLDAQGADVTARWPLRSFLELGALPSAVPCARLHARHLLWEWRLAATLGDSAELLVSEIVTNAVRITQADGRITPVRLWLLTDRIRLLILVWDASPLHPVPVSTTDDAENGRGLLLVDTLSTRWGHFSHPHEGKAMWALLDTA
jgi:anti-sigma regulatory factor (Ser/Thr protein kinase)